MWILPYINNIWKAYCGFVGRLRVKAMHYHHLFNWKRPIGTIPPHAGTFLETSVRTIHIWLFTTPTKGKVKMLVPINEHILFIFFWDELTPKSREKLLNQSKLTSIGMQINNQLIGRVNFYYYPLGRCGETKLTIRLLTVQLHHLVKRIS